MADLPSEFLDSLEEVHQGNDLSFLKDLQKPETITVNADARSLHKVLKLVQALNEASVRSGMEKWFSEGAPYQINELPKHVFEEMSHFFQVYKALEGKQTAAGEVQDRAVAVEVIKKARNDYRALFG